MVRGSWRARLKRIIPAPATRLVHNLRELSAGPPIDDVVLASYCFVADPAERPRLNLVVPNLTPGATFGGVTTGIEIYARAAALLARRMPIDLRLIVTDPTAETDVSPVIKATIHHDPAAAPLETLRISGDGSAVPVRRSDIFMTYNWWSTLNVSALIKAQAEHFSIPSRPLLYLIQEYEPQLYPFSSAHMLAREAYDRCGRLWGIFNSSHLHRYFCHLGHASERAFIFEPVISDTLRGLLPRVATSEREKQLLVYGRPGIARNCFPALMRGLSRWTVKYPEFRDWEVISAGTHHKPIALADGRMLRSVGKLSLDAYGALLLQSSAGISLMASPHPSYPPLEMAHMGMQVLTNGYFGKDLSRFHSNIVSIGSIGADHLADGLAEVCRRAMTAKPDAAANPEYIREDAFAFVVELVQAIGDELGGPEQG